MDMVYREDLISRKLAQNDETRESKMREAEKNEVSSEHYDYDDESELDDFIVN